VFPADGRRVLWQTPSLDIYLVPGAARSNR